MKRYIDLKEKDLETCVYKFFGVEKFVSGKGVFECKECNGEDKLYCPHYLSLRRFYHNKSLDEIKRIIKRIEYDIIENDDFLIR